MSPFGARAVDGGPLGKSEGAEAAWSAAAPTTTFTQQEPTEGARPTEASEIRVVIDSDALYIGAMFFDDPDGVLA